MVGEHSPDLVKVGQEIMKRAVFKETKPHRLVTATHGEHSISEGTPVHAAGRPVASVSPG